MVYMKLSAFRHTFKVLIFRCNTPRLSSKDHKPCPVLRRILTKASKYTSVETACQWGKEESCTAW